MEGSAMLFVASALSQICIAGYSQLVLASKRPILLEHSAVSADSERSNSSSIDSDSKNICVKNSITDLHRLYSSLERIIAAHPMVPPFYTLFDVHGQLQTTVQFMVRHFFIICGLCLPRLVSHGILGLSYGRLVYYRESFQLSDGGVIALDWASMETQETLPARKDIGTVIIYHGLGGSSRAEYVIYSVLRCLRGGFRVVVMNARGCGGMPLTNKTTYVGDKTSDVKEVVTFVSNRARSECNGNGSPLSGKVFLLGFSLGAASTLRYLSRPDVVESCELTAAACISPPWNVEKHTAVFWFWSFFLVLPMKAYIYHHQDVLGAPDREEDRSSTNTSTSTSTTPAKPTLSEIMMCMTLSQLDSLCMPHYGYKTVQDYHRHISPSTTAQHVQLPTLVVSASDDPCCCVEGIPADKHSRGPGLFVVQTHVGGHLAFPCGAFPYSEAWPDDITVEWFKLFTDEQTN